jgi:hypothetical protein
VYQGKYDAPAGTPPTVTETGAMTSELKVKHDKVIRQLDETGKKTILYINVNANQNVKLDPAKGQGFFAELAVMRKEKDKIIAGPDMTDLKAAVEKDFQGRVSVCTVPGSWRYIMDAIQDVSGLWICDHIISIRCTSIAASMSSLHCFTGARTRPIEKPLTPNYQPARI